MRICAPLHACVVCRALLAPRWFSEGQGFSNKKTKNGKYDRTEWKIQPHQELNDPSLYTPVENLRRWVYSFNEQKWGPNPTTMMNLYHTHTHYIHNINMAPSYKPYLCDVIYVYCKDTLPAVKNQEEVEISVHSYVLSMQQQQASYDEKY